MEKDLAEFIGIMLGDGCIGIYDCKSENKIKRQYQLKVTLNSRNKQYTKYVFNLITKILGVEPVIYYKKNENTADIRTFRKKKILYVLNEIGLKISPKWNRMEIPEKYFKKEFFPFILRGLFDTDGCLSVFNNNGTKYPRIEIKICPSPAQKQFVEILDKLEFRYTIQKLDKGKIRIRISGVKELKKWLGIIGSSNNSHIQKAEQFLKKKVL